MSAKIIKTVCSVPCNCCGSTDAEEIGRRDRDNNPLRTVVCRKCGLVWTDPRPNPDEVKKFYAKDYRIQYKGAYSPKLKHVYRAGRVAFNRYGQIKELLRAGDAVLDVGSGGGEFVYVLRKLGYDARGIEPNEGYGLYAQKELDLPVQIGFVQQIEFPAESFNVITLSHVLEHLDDPLGTLKKIRSWLRPEGFLVVEVPNVEGTCYAPAHRFHLAHLYNFNPVALETIGGKASFAVHKTMLTPDKGVIITTFKRIEHAPEISGEIPGNFERVRAIVARHTTFAHYLTLAPYTRPLQKAQQRNAEMKAIKGRASGQEVLDSIVSELTEQTAGIH
ncbi:MAG: class I SAM-dependent methyltransferase [Pyrinomonadaceae bacterium]